MHQLKVAVAIVQILLLCRIDGMEAQGRLVLNSADIDNWVGTISNNLINFRRTVLWADGLEENYKASGLTAKEVSDSQANQLLQSVQSRIQRLMWKTEQQVETIRTRAEQLFASYTARNYTCSEFTSQPYLRAAAVQNVEPTVNSTTAAPATADQCSRTAELPLSPDARLFNALTNRNASTAHVPQYVFDASNPVLNVANWTNGLEFAMRELASSDPTLQWQYFASRHGFLKIFPAVQWSPQIGLTMDPYDCRNQNWYLLSSTYPKDLVVVIDNSGSMKGSGSIMANRTLTEFLDTLTANDFFNVLLVMGTSNVSYVHESYSGTLLQATEANKIKMMELLNEDQLKPIPASRVLEAQGIGDLSAGLTQAFQLLRLVKQNNTAFSAGGVQAIALITDSSPEDFAAVFAQQNPNRQVRLFTFLMGQEARDFPVVKSMACSNRGFFSQVATLSNARESVQRYIPVMARPNSLSKDRFFTWSDVHQNQISTVGMSDTAKYALFTSASQAAYDLRTNVTSQEAGEIIGVAGVDVALDQFDRLGPAWELGPLAYIFIVNNNGFVIYHPELRTVDRSGNAALFYNNRDIADIEVPADFTPLSNSNKPLYNTTLRTALVLRQNGTVEFSRIRLYDDNSRSQRLAYRYLTTPLTSSNSTVTRQTPFSLGLALPWLSGRQRPLPVAYPPTSASTMGASLTSAQIGAILSDRLAPLIANGNSTACQQPLQLGIGLADFEFCDFPPALQSVYNASAVCAAVQVLALRRSSQTAMSCSVEFLDRLRVDAASSQGAPAAWRDAFANSSSSAPARLLGATGGHVFLWSGGSGLARWLVDPALNGSLMTPRWRNGSRDQLYERTVAMATDADALSVVLTPPSSTVVTATITSNASHPRAFPVLLTAPIRVAPGAVAAVAGAELDYARLESFFTSATNSCASSAGCNTCAQASVSCYLLDFNGIVVVSKERQDVGKAFDWVNCDAMRAMVDQRLFFRIQSYDFQSVCYRRIVIGSSASSLFSPIRSLLRLISGILLEAYLILSDLSSSLFSRIPVNAQFTNTSLTRRIVYASRATIGCQMYSLLQANSSTLTTGLHRLANISCSQEFFAASPTPCPSDIYAKQVDKTNLVFVAVVRDSGCQCQGCGPFTGTAEAATPANYSLEQPLRSKPSWTRSNIVLTDNSTACSSPADRLQPVPVGTWLLYWCLLSASMIRLNGC